MARSASDPARLGPLPHRVAFVADRVSNHAGASLETPTLELLSDAYYEAVESALRQIVGDVTTYTHPRDFIDEIGHHRGSVTLSLWSGERSWNRRALVPSTCEAYGLRYVGADAHAHLLCQDKFMAKRFAAEYGLRAPRGVLVRRSEDLDLLRTLSPPLVAKPNYEGGSIGISVTSLVKSHGEAERLATRILCEFEQPCLVEEFVPGREISIVLFGSDRKISITEAFELSIPARHFDPYQHIYGYELKKNHKIQKLRTPCTTDVPRETLAAARALFLDLGKVEVLRVDGRLDTGEFHLLELTTDVSFEPDCYLAAAFARRGYSFVEMLERILRNARGHVRSESASS